MGHEKTVALSEDVGLVEIVPLWLHVEFIERRSAAHTSRDCRRDAREEGLFLTQGFGPAFAEEHTQGAVCAPKETSGTGSSGDNGPLSQVEEVEVHK